jgi:lipoprotein-anchoring transpeptidase ErfK/SrfK
VLVEMIETETSRVPVVRRRAVHIAVPSGAAVVAMVLALAWLLLPTGMGEDIRLLSPTAASDLQLPAVVATTAVEDLDVFETPNELAGVVTTLSDTTDYGLVRTLLVLRSDGDWHEVLLPIRPNGSTGWVRAADVTLSTTSYRIEVSLSERTVTLFDNGTEVLHVEAAIGTDATPTPPGTYYVTDPVDLRDRPGTGYGAFALGISGFSDVLLSFAGGPGQLALHGTTNPADLGEAVSNGCVRVLDDVIVQIAEIVPLGTPVIVSA